MASVNDPAAIYSGTIDNTDRAIARLLAKLEEVDAPENTLIVYSSDNGSYRADRVGNLRGKKGSNYEGGIRVPGIISWPGTIAERSGRAGAGRTGRSAANGLWLCLESTSLRAFISMVPISRRS